MAIHSSTSERRPLLGDFLATLLSFTFIVAAALIAIGLLLPAFRVEQFWFFERDVTILGGIADLVRNGQAVLGWLLLLLSVLIPVGKTLVGLFISMFVRDTGPLLAALIGAFEFLGKLSFVDVFVIALLVIVLDGRALTAAQLGPGIYAYGSGVALSWIATNVLRSITKQALSAQAPAE